MGEITNWENVEINFESYQVALIPFTSFLEEEHYRLVAQRQKRKNGKMTFWKMNISIGVFLPTIEKDTSDLE